MSQEQLKYYSLKKASLKKEDDDSPDDDSDSGSDDDDSSDDSKDNDQVTLTSWHMEYYVAISFFRLVGHGMISSNNTESLCDLGSTSDITYIIYC